MRKWLLCIGMVVLMGNLVGCNASNTDEVANTEIESGEGDIEESNTEAENIEEGITMTLGELNSAEDIADFTLFKISTSNKVTGSLASGMYYENNSTDETYIDVVFDYTHLGTEAVNSDDLIIAKAMNGAGTEFTNVLYVVETDNGEDVSAYESIAPLSTVRFHCAISVPTSETDLTLSFVIGDKNYIYDYKISEVVSNIETLNVGDEIGDEEFATLLFNGIQYTDDLLPSNTSGSYSHYQIDGTDNTYLVINFDLTNYQGSAKEASSFVGIKAKYMDKYEYTGGIRVEDSDGAGFGSGYENIDPLATRKCYYLIEVPKSVIENEVELTISFDGKEYMYVGSAE
ncbi:MAG: hypothetical protein R3Y58_03230 [Eubacteriales bacterium]